MALRKLLVVGILAFTNMAVWAEDGSTFTAKTSENITMTFQVISEADKTCRVGNNYKECISSTTTKAVTVPAVAKDYKVVEIGNNAFQWCYNIPSVTLPEGITSIGSSAFSPCTGLKSINIPSTVVTIKERAFFNCSGLTSITLPPSVKAIGYSAFCGCSKMETVTLSEGLEEIGNEAFNYCQSLSTLVIPASVQTIGLNIVNNCSKIASLGVAQGNTVYDSRNQCNAIIETATNTLVCGCQSSVIPSDITAIADNAFQNCTGLTSITLPAGLKSIGASAFAGCTGITGTFELPSGVTHIGEYAFSGCRNMEGTLSLPAGLDGLNQGAFSQCEKLTGSLVFPEGVTSIPGYVFNQCKGLTGELVIPSTIQSIGGYAFYGCTGLTGEIAMPSGTTQIEICTFQDCSITKVTIPASVTTIDKYAFSTQTLRHVVFEGDAPSGYGGFWNVGTETNPAYLDVKPEYEENFKAAMTNGKFMDGYFSLTPAGIDMVKSGNHDTMSTCYDLQGRRVNKTDRGIHIQDGKKVLVK